MISPNVKKNFSKKLTTFIALALILPTTQAAFAQRRSGGSSSSSSRSSSPSSRSSRSDSSSSRSSSSAKNPSGNSSYGSSTNRSYDSGSRSSDSGSRSSGGFFSGSSKSARQESSSSPRRSSRTYDSSSAPRAESKGSGGFSIFSSRNKYEGRSESSNKDGSRTVRTFDPSTGKKTGTQVINQDGSIRFNRKVRNDGSILEQHRSGMRVERSKDRVTKTYANGRQEETRIFADGTRQTISNYRGRSQNYKYRPSQVGRSRVTIYVPTTEHYHHYHNSLFNDPWFWYWMNTRTYESSHPTVIYTTGESSLPHNEARSGQQAQRNFEYNWRSSFPDLPEKVATQQRYSDGTEWLRDYVSMEVMDEYSQQPGVMDRGLNNLSWLISKGTLGLWSYESLKSKDYVLGQELRAKLANQSLDAVSSLKSMKPLNIESLINKDTGVAKPYILIAHQDIETAYGSSDQICNVTAGDILELNNPIPQTDLAYVNVQQSNGTEGNCVAGSTVKIKLTDLQDAQNSFVQRVERGLEKVIEQKRQLKGE